MYGEDKFFLPYIYILYYSSYLEVDDDFTTHI